jgi:serine/threonine protein kinase
MDEPRSLVGEVLDGRYTLHEPLGRGGMSVVYRATDSRLQREVAVKVVHLPDASEALREELRRRFRREAASVARIPSHPNVVRIHDYGTDAARDLDYLVMELLEGVDLKESLRRGRMPLHRAVEVLAQASAGVAAGHRAGIIHRDVKPANVFLTRDDDSPDVRILDFGIAKAAEVEPEDDLTVLGGLPHSPAYAAPEQLVPGRAAGTETDVFQLGLVGFELFTGRRPFGPDERERIRRGEIVPLPWGEDKQRIDADLRRLIDQSLRPDPGSRPADAAAFLEALRGGRGGDDRTLLAPRRSPGEDGEWDGTLLAAPEPVAPRAASPPRRPLRVAALTLSAAILALLVWWVAEQAPGITPGSERSEPDPVMEDLRPLQSEAAERLERGER